MSRAATSPTASAGRRAGASQAPCALPRRGTPCLSTNPTVRKDPNTTILSVGSAFKSAWSSASTGLAWVEMATGPGPFNASSSCMALSCRAVAARGVGRSVKHHESTMGAMRRKMAVRSLSCMAPNTTWVRG